jgi:hypothetical protein
MGESILMFVLTLALSNAITLNLAFYLIRKARKPRKNSSGLKLVVYIACLIGLILAFVYLIFALVSIPVEIYAFLGVEGLWYYFEFTTWWIGIHLVLLTIVLYYVLYSSSEIMWLIKKRKEEKK